jgi:hypothetical protein
MTTQGVRYIKGQLVRECDLPNGTLHSGIVGTIRRDLKRLLED